MDSSGIDDSRLAGPLPQGLTERQGLRRQLYQQKQDMPQAAWLRLLGVHRYQSYNLVDFRMEQKMRRFIVMAALALVGCGDAATDDSNNNRLGNGAYEYEVGQDGYSDDCKAFSVISARPTELETFTSDLSAGPVEIGVTPTDFLLCEDPEEPCGDHLDEFFAYPDESDGPVSVYRQTLIGLLVMIDAAEVAEVTLETGAGVAIGEIKKSSPPSNSRYVEFEFQASGINYSEPMHVVVDGAGEAVIDVLMKSRFDYIKWECLP